MTVSRSLFTLERLGLVSSNYRHLRTNLYDLSSILWNTNIIRKLKKCLPALLLLLPYNVIQSSKINKINIYNNRSTLLHTKIWDSTTLVSKREAVERSNVMSEYNVKIQQSIALVEKIMPLTLNRKAWLTVFPSSIILEATKALRNLLKRGEVPKNPFGYIYGSCMSMCHREHIKVSHKTRLALKKKYNFSEDEPPLTEADLLYKPEKATQTVYLRPKKGMYAIWNSPDWNGETKQEEILKPATRVSELYNDTAYNDEASRTLEVICDEWEQKWIKQKEKFGDRIISFDKGLIKVGLISVISRHLQLYKANGLEKTIGYLKNIIFNVVAPSSIVRNTILSSDEYYSILAGKLNNFEKELENEGSNNNNTGNSYTPKKTTFMQKQGIRFAGEYKERYILDN